MKCSCDVFFFLFFTFLANFQIFSLSCVDVGQCDDSIFIFFSSCWFVSYDVVISFIVVFNILYSFTYSFSPSLFIKYIQHYVKKSILFLIMIDDKKLENLKTDTEKYFKKSFMERSRQAFQVNKNDRFT